MRRSEPSDVPIAAVSKCSKLACKQARLLDHLIGEREQFIRHGQPERLGGLESDDHLELGRRLNWKLLRRCAAQDAIDVGGGPAVDVAGFDAVRNQPPSSVK